MSGRGLCDELITHPEESYRLWCALVCDLETIKIFVNEEEEAMPTRGLLRQEKKYRKYTLMDCQYLVLLLSTTDAKEP